MLPVPVPKFRRNWETIRKSLLWSVDVVSSGESMTRCDHCGDHVSDRFERAFADEQGRVLACPNCSTKAGIAEVVQGRRVGDD